MVSSLQSRAVALAGPLVERFAPSAGRWLGWVGIAVGGVMIGYEPFATELVNPTVIFLGIVLACLSWVVLVRPQASAHQRGLLMRNMLRDVTVPWRSIERCAVGQTLVVTTTEGETLHGLGVTRSARSMMREQYGTTSILMNFASRPGQRRTTKEGPSIGRGEYQGGTYTSYVESRIAGFASTGERGSEGDPNAEPVVAFAPVPLGLLGLAAVCLVLALV